jgi:hypothetical protein
MISKIATRLRALLRILSGVRPAEVSFDELDQRIAYLCAAEAADTIASRFTPETDRFEEEQEVFRQIWQLVFEAISRYATHETHHGPVCRKQLQREKIFRALREQDGASDIPF